MVAVSAPARSSSGSSPAAARRRPLLASCALVLGALFSASCESQPPELAGERATVSVVIDGDTVDLEFGDGTSERARLIGIDTPESVSRSVPDQCFGKEASDATKGLLPPGTDVRVARDEEARDRYGRLLVYLYRVDDELFVNRWLVENGFADVLIFEPNTAMASDFSALAEAAKAASIGLWGSCEGPDQPLVSGG